MPNSWRKKMEAEQYLDKLREYRNFLKTQHNAFEAMRTGKVKRFFNPFFCDGSADAYRNAKNELEERFPELAVEDLTQIIDGVQGEEAEPMKEQ